MVCNELPIYKKCVELVDYIDNLSQGFSREMKCTYAVEIRRVGIDLIKSLCLANYSVGNSLRRAENLETALGNYETYKFTLRRLTKLHALSEKQSAFAEQLLAEIGEQLMGWYKKYAEHLINKQ